MFRIDSFEMLKHPLIKNKRFILSSDEENCTNNYFTIIIGPNGTGKSSVLSSIIEALNELSLMKRIETYKPKKRFVIVYTLNNQNYKCAIQNKNIEIKKNNKIISANQLELPDNWLACSVTINDKFPLLNYIRSKQISSYHYLGIRSASNNAFVSKITTSSVFHFIEALKKNRSKQLYSLYSMLSLAPEVIITFSGGPMLKLEKERSRYRIYNNIEELVKHHNHFINENKSKTSYRTDIYNRYINSPEKLKMILDFINRKRDFFEMKSKAQIHLDYPIQLDNQQGVEQILTDWNVLSIMLDLELIKINRFYLTKDDYFRYEEASSGEAHLLNSLHGLISNVDNNCLILIDEPEISLHPNWQIEYIDLLKKISEDFYGVHFIIASHSHFLMSNLKNEESIISSIQRDSSTGEIFLNTINKETFGWDPESILYNIFEVATLRNKYFELDLSTLISLISEKSQDKDKISDLLLKVRKYILSNEDDPLKLLVEEVDNYLK